MKKNILKQQKTESPIASKVFGGAAGKVEKTFQARKEAVFTRFPLLFTLLGAFGLVATFYGFEKVIDQTGLSDNPWILLAIGLVVLVFTGTLYKKLGN
jgi:hypothetical protein